ncbi:CLUMA_CG018347, isoform A [Clunio marinus]|uniref:CLUMA_CG018347, isoform A n=1 Tax=Clunio marinus TaxID=568069 RepID=A0A1J1J0I5_9DIPT|nr:CLUMA_CG018347, isoform A [Clunio marinus]
MLHSLSKSLFLVFGIWSRKADDYFRKASDRIYCEAYCFHVLNSDWTCPCLRSQFYVQICVDSSLVSYHNSSDRKYDKNGFMHRKFNYNDLPVSPTFTTRLHFD